MRLRITAGGLLGCVAFAMSAGGIGCTTKVRIASSSASRVVADGAAAANAPGLLGSAVSHGCVRISNAGVTTLAQNLPLGTPVVIA